jgi:virginiamycin A acetyltransferase
VRDGVAVIGHASYVRPGRIENDPEASGRLVVGSYTAIGPDVTILLFGGDHNPRAISVFPHRHVGRGTEIRIGNDVWIGAGATLMPGVSVADGAIVAADAVVTRDVGPFEVVAGNPARVIRTRFSDRQVEALRAIAWWSWPTQKVDEAVTELLSEDVAAFIAKHSSPAPRASSRDGVT